MKNATPIIPFFPLRIFLLPGEQVPLHIFEPRYQQLFDEAEDSGQAFVLPYETKVGASLGSLCSLVKVTKRQEDGSRDVVVECKAVFEVKSSFAVAPGKRYPGGELGEKISVEKDEASLEMLNSFANYIERKFGKRPSLSSIQHYSLMDIAACMALANEDKVRVLLSETKNARQDMLSKQLKYFEFLYYQEEQAENGIILN